MRFSSYEKHLIQESVEWNGLMFQVSTSLFFLPFLRYMAVSEQRNQEGRAERFFMTSKDVNCYLPDKVILLYSYLNFCGAYYLVRYYFKCKQVIVIL